MITRFGNHCLIVLAVLFCLNLVAEESRRWTGAGGKTIIGRLVIQDDTHVKIRSDQSGKIYTVPIDSLCRADREYLNTQVQAAAEPVPSEEPSDKASPGFVASALALGGAVILAIVAGIIIIGVVIQAVFLHMATRLLSFEGSFMTAIIGAVLVTIMQLAGQAIGYALFSSKTLISAGLGMLISALFGGFAVKLAYKESLGKCVVAYIVSLILYIVGIVCLLIVGALCLGGILAA